MSGNSWVDLMNGCVAEVARFGHPAVSLAAEDADDERLEINQLLAVFPRADVVVVIELRRGLVVRGSRRACLSQYVEVMRMDLAVLGG